MTAQGEDILAWLDRAITAREKAAKAAKNDSPSPWTANVSENGVAGYDRPAGQGAGLVLSASGEGLWDCEGSDALCMTAATARHVALSGDPESVLRRCAADRKLIELHTPTERPTEAPPTCPQCAKWDDDVAMGDQAASPAAYPCDTIRAVAGGYGWTEETSAPTPTQTPPSDGDQMT